MKNRNINLLYLHELFFAFTDSFLIMALPIFIYQLFHSLSAVFIFIVSWNIMYLSLFIPIFNLGMKSKKPKYLIVLGMIFYIISLFLFSKTGPENAQMIVPALVLFTLYISCYWMTRHWFFSVNADHNQIGKQISWLTIIRIIVSFLGPVVGGAISFYFSFQTAFLLAGISTFFSIIPVLFFHAPPHTEHYDWKHLRKILNKPELTAIRPAYFWEGFSHYFIQWCWMLAFFLFLGNIKDLGILIGFTTLIAAILTRITGHFFDQRKRTTLLDQTTAMRMLGAWLYASIFFLPAPVYVWTVDIYNRFSNSMHGTVVNSYLYAYSNKIHPVYFHLNREIHFSLARIISGSILAIIFQFADANFLWAAMAIGGITLLGWLSLKNSDHLLH